MGADNIDPALQERLLPAEEGGDYNAPEQVVRRFDKHYAYLNLRREHFWAVIRRFFVSGVKASGTIAFFMYLLLIYEKITLASKAIAIKEATERNSYDGYDDAFEPDDAISVTSGRLACAIGEPAVTISLNDAYSNRSFAEIANLSSSVTSSVYENLAGLGVEAVVPAACVNAYFQALNLDNNFLALFVSVIAQNTVCNQSGLGAYEDDFYDSYAASLCYDCLSSVRADANISQCFDTIRPSRDDGLSASSLGQFAVLQSELVSMVVGSVSSTDSPAAIKTAAVESVSNFIQEHMGQFKQIFGIQPTSPFLSLPPAYRQMGYLLMGAFVGFGMIDAAMSFFPKIDKRVRPYYYGLFAGFDTGLIKVLLLLSLFGKCQYPNRPTYEDYQSREKLTFLNIPVCKADIVSITLWSLFWLIPVCAVTAYFEFNKFNLSASFPKTNGFYLNKIVGFLQKRENFLSKMGLALSAYTGFLALMDLVFNHLAPYGAAVKGTKGAGLSAEGDIAIKLALAVPVMLAGVLVERRYINDKEHRLILRKRVAAFSELCKLMLFNYVALSFFVAYEYANGLHLNTDLSVESDTYSSSTMDITPWSAYWMLLSLSIAGSAIVVHDEWYYKMIPPEKADDEAETATIELDELGGEDNAPAETADDADPDEPATSNYYCSSAIRWLSSWFSTPKPAADESVRHVRFASTVATTAC